MSETISADDRLHVLILRRMRNGHGAFGLRTDDRKALHLRGCPDVQISSPCAEPEGVPCVTCGYGARLEARISCPHDVTPGYFEDESFYEMAEIIEAMAAIQL